MIKLLHESVDNSADRVPDKEAFRFLDTALTYEDLSLKSSRLASVLIEQGVVRGDRVGVYLRKSLDSAVAIYGIMKAGAAFLPIDPSAPAARIKSMLEHCGVRHLITNAQMQNNVTQVLNISSTIECVIGLPQQEHQRVRFVDWGEVERAPIVARPHIVEEDIAYIMYTSGSTGLPKGITHTHSSGLSYAQMITKLYGVQPSDRFGNHAPLHFDISTFDYFGAPLCGATTVIIPEPYMKLPASLSELMEKERLTLWFSVPHALIQLLEYGVLNDRDLSSLRWVIFGGEPFPPKHLHALMSHWPQARFSNSYGPAEVNMCAYYHVDEPVGVATHPLPIGRMWDIAEGLIVDEDDTPVEPGQPGELLVCSSTRMLGYWNEPKLNKKCFYNHSMPAGKDKIFYRTGDLVSDSGEGKMKFLGRKDRQVKLRGFRIELDEIEFVLAQHEGVEEAAAYTIAPQNTIGAAITPKHGFDLNSDQLVKHCSAHLSNYMVPEIIRIVSSFPRTTSNKIDRRKLGEMFSNSKQNQSQPTSEK